MHPHIENARLPAPAAVGVALDDPVRLVVAGHVDHGKSTLVGRLLAETGSLPDGKLDELRRLCERNAKPFEHAFLVDALKDERAQGITIDAARVFMKTATRRYIVMDAPGHVDFLKNMVTGAWSADAALLVIDASEGVRDNSRRHGYLLSMLGIPQIAVIVNKMDLVDYDRRTYDRVVSECSAFLEQLGVRAQAFVPVAAQQGANVSVRARPLAWYDGPTVVETMDGFEAQRPAVDAAFRMPVQGVYKFTERNDSRRIVAGTVDTGRLRVNDEIVFFPSGKRTRVETIEGFNHPPAREASAGQAAGFTMADQVYVGRGEIATRADELPPEVTTRIRVSLFWLGRQPLRCGGDYVFKLGTARVPVRVEAIHQTIDLSQLEPGRDLTRVDRHQAAECVLVLGRPVAFDVSPELTATRRFVLVDDLEIAGGGIVREALSDGHAWMRDKVLRRNLRWDASHVSEDRRAERYSQRPVLVLVTGDERIDRKTVAREFEAQLFDEGRFVYFLGMGNLVHGVDADLGGTAEDRPEHLRRLGEVSNILLDAGLVVIAAAARLAEHEVEIVRTAVGHGRVCTVWLGDKVNTTLAPDLLLSQGTHEERLGRMKRLLQDRGVIFRGH
jgi:bifunctional enzyme CysN/CysC